MTVMRHLINMGVKPNNDLKKWKKILIYPKNGLNQKLFVI